MKFEQYVQEANKFVSEVALELGIPDTDQAYRVMTAVLHTIRDIITPEESLHLISQLPMLLKATYVNGWHLKPKTRVRSMDEFIECLLLQNPRTAPRDFGNDERAKDNTRAVLNVLKRHVSAGEIQDIMDQFPMELAELWLVEPREHT